MPIRILEEEKEGHRKVKTDFRKKRLKKFKEKITGKFLRAFPENLKKDFQKHKQTENVKRLMTTGGAYKKRTPIKVVSESTPKKGTGKLGPSGQSGYKFYNKGGRAGKQFGGRTNLLEELGRVEAEPSNRNRRAEISRVHGELNRGYKHGKRVGKSLGGAATHGFNTSILRKS